MSNTTERATSPPTLAEWLRNWNADPMPVRHTDLERHGESPYRSKCPKCERGILLVRRDQKTFQLLAEDRCISCAQLVVYLDDEIGSEPVQR